MTLTDSCTKVGFSVSANLLSSRLAPTDPCCHGNENLHLDFGHSFTKSDRPITHIL